MPNLNEVLESTNLPGSPESLPSGSSDASEGEFPFGALPAEEETGEPSKVSEEAPADKTAGEIEQLRQKNADLDVKLTRSNQEIANYKQRIFDLGPVIEAGMQAKGQTPAPVQQGQQQVAANPQVNTQDAFLGKIEEIVQRKVAETWDQKNFDSRQVDKLEKRALAEIEGFDKMRDHPAYLGMINAAIWLQGQGSLKKTDEDEHYSAMKHAHSFFLASNPDYMKAVKETGKKEALDKAEIKAVAASAGGTSKSADVGGEREPTQEEKDRVEILKAFRGGRRMLPSARR